MKTVIIARHTKTSLRTAAFFVALLSTTALPILWNPSPALATTNNYPASIGGCKAVSGNPPGTFTCDLKDSTQDLYFDPWLEENRECTSYAAWMLSSVNGFTMPFNDDAVNWGTRATGLGYTVNMTPQVGSIYWSSSSDHVAWVEAVSANGTTVNTVDYNAGFPTNPGLWAEHIGVATNSASGYIHFKDISNAGGTLNFIKTTNTGSGTVEIHTATPTTYQTSNLHATTRFNPADANNGWFQMFGSDLYFIKTKNTTSGAIEVHSATAASGYQSGIDVATIFSNADANNGWFQIAGSGRDLVFIKTTNTGSGKVEFFRATASSNYNTVVTATTTPFYPSDASNGWFQAQNLDLVFIKTKNTGSGKVEYFRVSASSGYQTVTVATATAFSPLDANNGWFSSEDVNNDGIPDMEFIKTHNTTSGQVELFIADGYQNFQQITTSATTWLSPADANNGWFLVDSKN